MVAYLELGVVLFQLNPSTSRILDKTHAQAFELVNYVLNDRSLHRTVDVRCIVARYMLSDDVAKPAVAWKVVEGFSLVGQDEKEDENTAVEHDILEAQL